MKKNIEKYIKFIKCNTEMSRRDVLRLGVSAGAGIITLPFHTMRHSHAANPNKRITNDDRRGLIYSDWIAEARIAGLSISGIKVDPLQLKYSVEQLIRQNVTVIEVDSQLSDYQSEEDFTTELQRIRDVAEIIHQYDLKVIWYIPSLEVITPNGLYRTDSFARTHPDWLQLSFDGETSGVFYGQQVFWVEKNDESAWLCPNSPYRDWFIRRLRQLAGTGIDGIWLDVPIFDQIVVKWGCSCPYCREKYTSQTGNEFPSRIDITDKSFWRFIRWRHETITEFLEDCRKTIQKTDPGVIAIAEIVALDHIGATLYGSEGSSLTNILVVWEVDAISETTAMAEASYDDWMAMHNIYKYCRGATMERPSWVFCYGYNESDGQLVIASAVAAQNNPYELRTPGMGTSIGMNFRELMYSWIAKHSKQIYRSQSIAPVAVIYSERNRDLLDALNAGGIFISQAAPGRNRKWLGRKSESPVNLEYMGDYRGLSILLYQNQIPTDVYPISTVSQAVLNSYPVLVLPNMASLTEAEKEMLLKAVNNGSNLIVTGPEPGMWDANGIRRETSIWSKFPDTVNNRFVANYGNGKLYFWLDQIGQKYLKSHDDEITNLMLGWLKECGVETWISKKLPVIIQPYLLGDEIVIHLLNYSWIGKLSNQPKRLELELSIPWKYVRKAARVTQSEPQWRIQKDINFANEKGKLVIPLEIGINALIIIELD